MDYVRTEILNGVGSITMCRSGKMNAFDDPFIGEMIEAFGIMEQGGVRAVILRAEKSAKVWSAGRDVQSLPTGLHDIEGWDTELTALGRAVLECPVPSIAMIEGNVWGLACEIAFSCDLVVAVPETSFAITPARLGVPYTLSGLQTLMERLGPNLAKEMLLCATPFSAERLYAQGVINHVVSGAEIEEFTQALARKITSLAPLSIAALKRQISEITRAHDLPTETLSKNDKRAKYLLSSEDFKEGISALKQKRRPKFQGK